MQSYTRYSNHQVGGYTEEYNSGAFKLVTVRNAGHMVPYMQPERALTLFQTFLKWTPMPTTAPGSALSG